MKFVLNSAIYLFNVTFLITCLHEHYQSKLILPTIWFSAYFTFEKIMWVTQKKIILHIIETY